MIPVKYIDPEDLPLYAMQLLPPEQMAEMAEMLEHSVQGRRTLAEIYADLSLYAHAAELKDPPTAARARLLKQIANEKRLPKPDPLDKYRLHAADGAVSLPASSLDEVEPIRKPFVIKAAPWAGWLIAAGLAAFAVLQRQQTQQLSSTVAGLRSENASTEAHAISAGQLMETLKDPSAVHATLTAAEATPAPAGRVTYVANKGSLVFIASNMAPLEPSKTYELWVIPADGRPSMPAGTFKPDSHGNASIVLPELPQGVEAKAFGITIESGEGSPVPTPPIIMKGLPS